MKALSELNVTIATGAKPDSIVSKRLTTFIANRDPDKRRTGIHVTSLLTPCLRRLFYQITNPDLPDLPHNPDTIRLFDNGKAAHSWWQNRYYGPAGMLVGNWECSVCGRVATGPMPDGPCGSTVSVDRLDTKFTTTCASRHAVWKFVEPSVSYQAYGLEVVGNTDGILLIKDVDHILEMKTMRSDIWDELNKPEPKDVFQASIYAWLLGIDHVFISYINKNTWKTKDYKREADTIGAAKWVDSQLSLIADAIKKQDPKMASRACASKTVSRAKRCGARDLCF